MKNNVSARDLDAIRQVLEMAGLDVKFSQVERLGGMTNRTFHLVRPEGDDLVVRLPGEGTDELINRADEQVSTNLACHLGIDSDLLYFDRRGYKISRYIPNAHTMTAEDLRQDQHILEIAEIFRRLHACGVDTRVPFEVFSMAADYEAIIEKNHVALYEDYHSAKRQVMQIKASLDQTGLGPKVPCHNDSLCANWVHGSDKLYLIDWEYAGMNDAMWDLADVSIEAEYSEAENDKLLSAYFGREATLQEKMRFVANMIYLDYLWTLWGLTRVPYDGDVMQAYADARYERLKQNLAVFWSQARAIA